MGTKTISIRTDTYDILKDEKRDGESFSDAIDRLLGRKKINLADYFGAIENDDLLRGHEADSTKIREFSSPRI